MSGDEAGRVFFAFYLIVTISWFVISGLGVLTADEFPKDGGPSRKLMARAFLLTPIWPLAVIVAIVGVIAWAIASVWRIAFDR